MSTSPLYKHGRSESEVTLTQLDYGAPLLPRQPHSLVSDEDLESLCPPLGKSEIEEAEEEFALRAERALSFIKTPPASSAEGENVYSPYMQSPPPPDVVPGRENPYFRSAQLLGSSSRYYTSDSSTPSSGYTSSSSYASSSASSCDSFPPTPPSEHVSSFRSPSLSSSPLPPTSQLPAFTSRRHNAPRNITMPSLNTTSGFTLHDTSLLRGCKSSKGSLSAAFLDSSTYDPLASPKLRLKRSTGFAF